MKYELETIEKLVQDDIEPSKLNLNNFDDKKYEHWTSFINTEVQRIKKAINKSVFRFKKEKQIELYVQHHQQALILLTDHLINYFYPEEETILIDHPEDHNIIKLYKYIYKCLDDLLNFIETYFSNFFNQNAKIPNSYKIVAVWQVNKLLPVIRENFSNSKIDQQLIEIITSPLNRFKTGKDNKDITYRHLIYLKKLLKELDELSHSQTHTTRLKFKILSSLTYLNFNSLRFVNYCTKNIKQIYQKTDTLHGQLEKLAWIYKSINQLQEKPGVALKPNSESLKELLVDWINNETYFLETKQQLSLNFSVQGKKSIGNNLKIYTNMSVAQLAYLIKLFHESGIIQNKNQTELLKAIALCFRTKKAEEISVESLRSKFYNVENNTRDAVKENIINLLNQISKN